MKKLLSVLMACFMLFCLTACNGFSINVSFNKPDSSSSSSENSCTEHIWGEWKTSETSHWREYVCGCPWPDIAGLHVDNDENGNCDVCGYVMEENSSAPDNIFLGDLVEWLETLSITQVIEIKTITENADLAPGRFKEIRRTTDRDTIFDFIQRLSWLGMKRISPEEFYTGGNDQYTIEFTLQDSGVKRLCFKNGKYDSGIPDGSASLYFQAYEIPTLEKYETVENSYSFITQTNKFVLMTADGESEGTYYVLNKFEFIPYVAAELPVAPTHYIEIGSVTIYVCSDSVFYLMNGESKEYYQLIGGLKFNNLKDFELDFDFQLTWGVYGISSYNSETGRLVKNNDAADDSYITTHYLTAEERAQIYTIVEDLNVLSYPDTYNPTEGLGSYPYLCLVLRVEYEGVEKVISARQVALSGATSEKGQKFMDACDAISDILMGTDAWKALPDYPYMYD